MTEMTACSNEYGKCQICGKVRKIYRTYFYYDIKCECCGCIIDGRPMHFELVRHCGECVPKIPKRIMPVLRMQPFDITGDYEQEGGDE